MCKEEDEIVHFLIGSSDEREVMLVSDNLVDFTPSHLSIRINHDVIVVNPHVFPV